MIETSVAAAEAVTQEGTTGSAVDLLGLPQRAELARVVPPFVLSRAILLLIGWLGALLLPLQHDGPDQLVGPLGATVTLARITVHFDAGWFLSLAQNGYALPGSSSNWLQGWGFMPLWPGLMRLVSLPLVPLFGTSGALLAAGLLLANAAGLLSCILLRRLVAQAYGERAADLAVTLLLVFPTTLFLSVPYAESIFLLLSLLAFAAVQSERWLLAGICIALAFLTRVPGALLGVALLPYVWMATSDLRTRLLALTCAGGPALLAAVGYVTISHALTGIWIPVTASQTQYFAHRLTPPVYPLARFVITPQLASPLSWDNVVNGLLAYVALALVVPAWRRFGTHWGLWLLLSVLLPLSTGGHYFSGVGRYMLVAFPLVATAAVLINRLPETWRPNVERWVLGVAAPLAGMWVLLYVANVWASS